MNLFTSKLPLADIGVNPMKFFRFLKSLAWLFSDYHKLQKQLKGNKDFKIKRLFLIADDKYDSSGSATGHYFHQDLLVAQKIFKKNPERHIDIWSRVDGFVAHVAAFRKIEVLDIRPLENKTENINFVQQDLMSGSEDFKESVDSLSCLHTIEHFGLGRYNDPIDVDGHIKGLNNMYTLLKKWGTFYFSTPISQRIEFNAHRVFSVKYLLEWFEGKYKLETFSYVDDAWDLHKDIELTEKLIKNNCWCEFGCGIFELVKI